MHWGRGVGNPHTAERRRVAAMAEEWRVADISCEQRTEPVPPQPHGFVANVDPALEQQVFHVPQALRKPDVHHDDEADDLGRGVEIAERAG